MKSLVLFCILLLFSSPVLAASAISCHCFRDRSFDAQRPAAADTYLLATTQNSFLSAVFDMEKREIVRAKMAGASGDALWVEGFIARKAGLPVRKVSDAREEAADWQQALTRLNIAPDVLGERFAAAATSGAGQDVLAEIAAEEMLQASFGISPAELVELRAEGAGTKEIVLAQLLAGLLENPAPAIYGEFAAGSSTWGELLDRSGLVAEGIEEAVRRRVAEAGSEREGESEDRQR